MEKYSTFQVNEKISWKNLLIALSLCYLGDKEIKNLKVAKAMYNDISNADTPTKRDNEIIEQIRKDVIDIVQSDNTFIKFNRPYIIDSLKTIQFKIIDEIDDGESTGRSAACYLNLDNIKSNWRYKHIFKYNNINRDNFIIIGRQYINEKGLPNYITHEMYHFLDRMLGDNGMSLSAIENPTENIVDKNVLTNKKWALKKLSLISSGQKYSELPDDLKRQVEEDYNYIMSNKNYYTSNSELFARWKAYKTFLLNRGFISNINQKMTTEELVKSLDIYNKNRKEVDGNILLANIDLLFFIDFQKVQDINF